MHLRAPAIVCATRPHGETAVIVRLLTRDHGLVAAFVAGGRGRQLRPVLIPGNVVDAEINARSDSQLPWARLELVESRGPWLTEPLPAAAITWATALAATALAERHPYPPVFDALASLLDAICVAPSARGWVPALLAYEVLLMRELGHSAPVARPDSDDWDAVMAAFTRIGRALARYPLADRRGDVMAARAVLGDRLARIEG